MRESQASHSVVQAQSASAATLPLWSYSTASSIDGKTYQGQIVGRSPFYHGQRSTSVTVYLVPVAFTLSDSGTVFDPTAPDGCLGNSTVLDTVQQSPLFNSTQYVMNGVETGNTQYIDAFQRANFWTNVSVAGNSYHTLLKVKTASVQRVTVPLGDGFTAQGSCPFANIDLTWWDNYIRATLMPELASQGIDPTTFPLFLSDSVRVFSSDSGALLYGYHSAYMPSGVLQTYGYAEFNTAGTDDKDISIISHELAEWLNDPMVSNPTPAWGHVGEVFGCESSLEVADPLTGTYIPVPLNGFNYNVQELVFFSWFYRQSPSLGAGGIYSDNGTMTSTAGPVCI